MKLALIMFVVLSLVLMGAAVGATLNGVVNGNGIEVRDTFTVTVQGGDTIWKFVNMVEYRELYNGHQIVAVIRDLNDLDPKDHLRAGQQLILPVLEVK